MHHRLRYFGLFFCVQQNLSQPMKALSFYFSMAEAVHLIAFCQIVSFSSDCLYFILLVLMKIQSDQAKKLVCLANSFKPSNLVHPSTSEWNAFNSSFTFRANIRPTHTLWKIQCNLFCSKIFTDDALMLRSRVCLHPDHPQAFLQLRIYRTSSAAFNYLGSEESMLLLAHSSVKLLDA